MAGRPAVYFHVEFGVSWTPGQPKTRQATYASKSLKNPRNNTVPRLLPAPNSGYLAVSPPPDQQYLHQFHAEPRHLGNDFDLHHQRRQPHPARGYYEPQYYQPQYPVHSHHAAPLQERRRSRSLHSRSSADRGKSAPPPLKISQTNPWEAEPEPMAATILPPKRKVMAAPNPQATLGKNLPATPGQFRLGEDGMPWSATFPPPGFVEEMENDNGEGSSPRAPFPPRRSSKRVDDRDKTRVTEIESLAAAMMTVDNGFEDQWWYQGPRLVNVAGELKSSAALEDLIASRERSGSVTAADEIKAARDRLGSLVSPLDEAAPPPTIRRSSLPTNSPASSLADIVSPISEFSSPASTYRPTSAYPQYVPPVHHPSLRRTLTTRSDELHM